MDNQGNQQGVETIKAPDAAQLQEKLSLFMQQAGYDVFWITYSIVNDEFVAKVSFQTA